MRKPRKTTKKAEEQRELNVAGRLTIWGARDLQDALTSEIGHGGNIVLQMAENDEMDIAGLQVLLAAQKTAEKSGQRVQFPRKLPKSIQSWLTRAGVSVELGR